MPLAEEGSKDMTKFLKILGPSFLALSVNVFSIFAPPKPAVNDPTERIQQQGETRGHQIEQEKKISSSDLGAEK